MDGAVSPTDTSTVWPAPVDGTGAESGEDILSPAKKAIV
jgi:hypothetical protein